MFPHIALIILLLFILFSYIILAMSMKKNKMYIVDKKQLTK